MNNLLKYWLITVISMYMAGCSSLQQSPDLEYITPVKEVSLNLGETAIINGAMEHCGRDARKWVEVSYLLPYSQTGFFSHGGRTYMKSDKCKELAPVLAIKFTANKVGSESFDILGTPTNIVVSDNTNSLQSSLPKPSLPKSASPNQTTAEPAKPSMLDTLRVWIDR